MKNKIVLFRALSALFLIFAVNITAHAGTSSSPPNSFGDFVWNDLDGDGFQDIGEPGLGGIEVHLCGTIFPHATCNGVDIFETTDVNGFYQFSGFSNSEKFIVEILTIPLGFTPTTPTSILFDNGSRQLDGMDIETADFGFQAVVPVPAAIWLFGSGLLGLLGLARRKRAV